MILQFGLACVMIWLMNHVFIIREIVQHTPNWRDPDVTGEDIAQNFIRNTSFERLHFIKNLHQFNQPMLISGLSLLVLGMFL
jgi:hypothetical protein